MSRCAVPALDATRLGTAFSGCRLVQLRPKMPGRLWQTLLISAVVGLLEFS